MCTLKKVTFDYIATEDRVRLSGECEQGGQRAIWLTRRLLDRLVPVLLAWIEQHAIAASGAAATGDASRRASRADALLGFAQQAARQKLVQQQPVHPRADDAWWLACAAQVKRGRHGVLVAFRGSEQGQEADLRLHVNVLRSWLNILYDTYRKADWPLGVWPDWVREAAIPRSGMVRH